MLSSKNRYSIYRYKYTRHNFISSIPSLEVDKFASRLDKVAVRYGLLVYLGKGKGHYCTYCKEVHHGIEREIIETGYGGYRRADYAQCPNTKFKYDVVTTRKQNYYENGFVTIPRTYKGEIIFDTYYFMRWYVQKTMSFKYSWRLCYRMLYDKETKTVYSYNKGITMGYGYYGQQCNSPENFSKGEYYKEFSSHLIVDKRFAKNTMLDYVDWSYFKDRWHDIAELLVAQLDRGRVEFLQKINCHHFNSDILKGNNFKEMFDLKYASRNDLLYMFKHCGADFDFKIYYDYLEENLEKFGKLETKHLRNLNYKKAHERRIAYRDRLRRGNKTDAEYKSIRRVALYHAEHSPLSDFAFIELHSKASKEEEGRLMVNCIGPRRKNIYRVKVKGMHCFSLQLTEDKKIQEVRTIKNGVVPKEIQHKIMKAYQVTA